MAYDFFSGKNAGRDFARGEPPPWHSHEWARVEIPEKLQRQSAMEAAAREKPKKRRWWPLFVLGGVVGLAISMGKD